MRITTKILLLFLIISCTSSLDQQEVIAYHENGNTSYVYYLKDGKRNGTYKEYYPSGKIQIEKEYLMDSIVAQKITDINGKVLVNYKIKNGRYYGLLGSSDCISVFPELK